ncbi:D-alanine--D-alanine ligase|uniref:D-alanine--D-alanine ligase n=1 Tax=Dendrosporobacter quercicolus TaxID=146817 RepID=A0A1G9MD33_9FIRM|nr:D-alanine--D-alanine ligase [Dendrosporobacter quercicolus]NSL46998.1 D-alanine--D-alanine ligase [Dendrosporobacter quercicolus DSM 1736]SDL72023.1 D-alanine-D-alanine ligase [Dendrosporobacter quercicolus]
MKSKKIAVLMGGPSDEREVSLNTGNAILQALREKGYQAIGLDLIPQQLFEQLKEHQIEVVFNAIHGKYGEDGAVQGALELIGIPYTGSGLMASAVAMDKAVSKRLFLAAGIPTPRSRLYRKTVDKQKIFGEILAEFSIPVVVKSSAQGSSIGVTIVEEENQLLPAIDQAFDYSNDLLVEQFIDGREVTVAVWGDSQPQALPMIEIVPHSGRYDYRSKYTKGATDYIIPARLDERTASQVQQAAVSAFTVLGCRGIARVDIMIDRSNNPYVLEVNTIPGMTATSLVPKSAAAAGISFADLCERLLLSATI